MPTDKGANAGLKVASLVAGMVAGADSIDDMALLRHGGMGRVFDRAYAPSTLGSFLRAFTFGHVRQLDAVASRFLTALAAPAAAGRRRAGEPGAGRHRRHDHRGPRLRQAGRRVRLLRGPRPERAAGHGHHRAAAPVIVAQRLRKGSAAARPRGAATAGRRRPQDRRAAGSRPGQPVAGPGGLGVLRPATVGAAVRAGADVSVTVRLDPAVKAAIAAIGDDAWTPIEYTDAVFDEATGTWISRAEVAEIPFTAFASQKKRRPGPRPAGRAPHPRPQRRREEGHRAGHPVRHLAVPRLLHHHRPRHLDTVAADKTHRGHAIIEQVHADLKNSALAHLPSGKFTANAAWLVLAVIAFNLTRAAASLTAGPDAGQGDHRHDPPQARSTSPPGSRPPPDGSPCTCPTAGPGRPRGPGCSTTSRTTRHRHDLTTQPQHGATEDPAWNTPTARSGNHPRPSRSVSRARPIDASPPAHRWIEVKYLPLNAPKCCATVPNRASGHGRSSAAVRSSMAIHASPSSLSPVPRQRGARRFPRQLPEPRRSIDQPLPFPVIPGIGISVGGLQPLARHAEDL